MGTRRDAELIDSLLSSDIRPTAVLINPPFSRSIGRGIDSIAGLRHLRAALLRLTPGGRRAVILPDRVNTESEAWRMAPSGCGLSLHLLLPAKVLS